MPKYRVKKKVVSYETVLVVADSAVDAENRVLNSRYWDRFETDPNSHTTEGTIEDVTCLGEVETGAKQFTDGSIVDRRDYCDDEYRYYFSGAMVSTCSPLLDDCDDNHDVTRLLKKHKVVRKGTMCDPESCSVYFNFKTKSAAQSFIKRLNTFLHKRYDQVQKGKTFSYAA